MKVRLMTWNVLHRVHGEKWSRHVVGAFPDEGVRTARIAARVAAWLAEGVEAICLQEVSGDQLAALRGVCASVHAHRYPRVPFWLKFWARPLADRSEHLVTLTAGPSTRRDALTYPNEPGKGLLAVELEGGIGLVNTHLAFGRAGLEQLAQATAVLRRSARGVLVGDFNLGRDAVVSVVGEGVAVSQVAGATHGQSRRHGPGQAIDHIACRGGALEKVELLDAEGLSDHHPLRATLHFDEGPDAHPE